MIFQVVEEWSSEYGPTIVVRYEVFDGQEAVNLANVLRSESNADKVYIRLG